MIVQAIKMVSTNSVLMIILTIILLLQ